MFVLGRVQTPSLELTADISSTENFGEIFRIQEIHGRLQPSTFRGEACYELAVFLPLGGPNLQENALVKIWFPQNLWKFPNHYKVGPYYVLKCSL